MKQWLCVNSGVASFEQRSRQRPLLQTPLSAATAKPKLLLNEKVWPTQNFLFLSPTAPRITTRYSMTQQLKEKLLFFCTLSLMIRIFTIIYNVLQHYYHERCSQEGWSSLPTSPLAENGTEVQGH